MSIPLKKKPAKTTKTVRPTATPQNITESGEKLMSALQAASRQASDLPPPVVLNQEHDKVPTLGDAKRHSEFYELYNTVKEFISGRKKFDPTNPILAKLHNASMRDLVWCLTELADQLRLEEGKATENIAVSKRVAIVLSYSDLPNETVTKKIDL